jgi:hypothetical protein
MFVGGFTAAVAYVCPSRDEIAPCYCLNQSTGLSIGCEGRGEERVTQNTINSLFEQLHASNPKGLEIHSLRIGFTDLTALDITPLTTTKFNYLNIARNSNLTSIHGPPSSLEVKTMVELAQNSLNEKEFGKALGLFLPQSSFQFALQSSYLTSTTFKKWTPILLKYPNLGGIYLGWNLQFEEIESNLFKDFGKLNSLGFGGTPLQVFNDGAFAFDPTPSKPIRIDLNFCNLNETSLTPNLGFDKITYGLDLQLRENYFFTIPASVFEPILKNEKSSINFYANPIICDERVKWLKDGKHIYESRVLNALCINDRGYNVFTSNKIP